MDAAAAARYELRVQICNIVIGTLGIIGFNIALFCTPTPRYIFFWFNRTVGDHPSTQHLVALFNCMIWLLYGSPFVKPDIIIATYNVAGCFIAMVYLILFAIYSKSCNHRRKVIALLILEVIVVSIIAAVILSMVHNIKLRYHIVGTIAVICQLGTFVVPLSAMKAVITTRNIEHINIPVPFLMFGCNMIWVLYAAYSHDIYLTVPNAVGMVIEFLHFSVYYGMNAYVEVKMKEHETELP